MLPYKCANPQSDFVRRFEKGAAHFEKLLKRAYDAPLSGVTVGLIFSVSHAHIEACSRLGRFGKAENTVTRLKELAERADQEPIPYAIANIAQRLHVWWRDKRATLHSRQARASQCCCAAIRRACKPLDIAQCPCGGTTSGPCCTARTSTLLSTCCQCVGLNAGHRRLLEGNVMLK